MKFHHKKKNYPGRWLVKGFEMMLVSAIVFLGLAALGSLLAPVPRASLSVNPQTLEYNISQNGNTFEYRPAQRTVYDAQHYFAQGVGYHQQNDYYEAIQSYTRTLTTDADFAPAYLNRGVAYETLGEPRRAKYDFNQWLTRDSVLKIDMGRIVDGDTSRVFMAEGKVYAYTFYAVPGQTLNIRATADDGSTVDPLILVVDEYGNPVVADDDIRRESGSLISMDSAIEDYTVQYMGCSSDGAFTLLVSHTGGGSYGNMTVEFEID